MYSVSVTPNPDPGFTIADEGYLQVRQYERNYSLAEASTRLYGVLDSVGRETAEAARRKKEDENQEPDMPESRGARKRRLREERYCLYYRRSGRCCLLRLHERQWTMFRSATPVQEPVTNQFKSLVVTIDSPWNGALHTTEHDYFVEQVRSTIFSTRGGDTLCYYCTYCPYVSLCSVITGYRPFLVRHSAPRVYDIYFTKDFWIP